MSTKEQLPNTVTVTPSGDEVSSPEGQNEKRHFLVANVDTGNKDVYLNFSTRRAMYDFAVSLLQEAVYGKSGQKEFLPYDGQMVVDGVRMTEDSSRLFIFYNEG